MSGVLQQLLAWPGVCRPVLALQHVPCTVWEKKSQQVPLSAREVPMMGDHRCETRGP